MRFLVDECMPRDLTWRLKQAGHDVVSAQLDFPGNVDAVIGRSAFEDDRIVITEDRDFGELVVRYQMPAKGLVIAHVADFPAPVENVAEHIAQQIIDLGDQLLGCLTTIELGRVRQRDLD